MADPRRADDADGPVLTALMAWRRRLIGWRVSRAGLKRPVWADVAFGGTDVEQIRAMLPGSVAEHAEDLAVVLTGRPRDAGPGRANRAAAPGPRWTRAKATWR